MIHNFLKTLKEICLMRIDTQLFIKPKNKTTNEEKNKSQATYDSLLITLLGAFQENFSKNGIDDYKILCPIIDQNIHLVDETFFNELRAWENQCSKEDTLENNYALGLFFGNLACAFHEILTLKEGGSLVTIAIITYGYEFYVDILRRLDLKGDLASPLNGLGVAYLTRAQWGIYSSYNLKRAITVFQESLQIQRQLKLDDNLLLATNDNLKLAETYQAQLQLGIDPIDVFGNNYEFSRQFLQLQQKYCIKNAFDTLTRNSISNFHINLFLEPQVWEYLAENWELLSQYLARNWVHQLDENLIDEYCNTFQSKLEPYNKFLFTLSGYIEYDELRDYLTQNLNYFDFNLIPSIKFTIEYSISQFPDDSLRLYLILGNMVGIFSDEILRFKDNKSGNALATIIVAYSLILEGLTQENSPVFWAQAKMYLGIAYKDFAYYTSQPKLLLEVASNHLGSALEVYSEEKFPDEWVYIQSSLGLTYAKLKDYVKNPEIIIQKAITYFESSLRVYGKLREIKLTQTEREHARIHFAHTLFNLGKIYLDLASYAENLKDTIKKAIDYFDTASQYYYHMVYSEADSRYYYHVATSPQICIEILNNRGMSHLQLGSIHNAIHDFYFASEIYNLYREEFQISPRLYVQTLLNLSETYLYLVPYTKRPEFNKLPIPHKTPEDLIEQAIRWLNSALNIYSDIYKDNKKLFSEEWGNTHKRLGDFYLKLLPFSKTQKDVFEKIFDHYLAALKIYNQKDFPDKWAIIQHQLGMTYQNMVELRYAENFKQAIEYSIYHYNCALQVWTEDKFPFNWTLAQYNLGNAYAILIKFSEDPEPINTWNTTIKTLKLISRQFGLPEYWVSPRYEINWSMDIDTKNRLSVLAKTVDCYQLALRYASAQRPVLCLSIGTNLGRLGFTEGAWDLAIEGYSAAVEAVEQRRAWATSETHRQDLVREFIDVYENLIQAAVNQGDLALALRTVERSRSKRLADLIIIGDLYVDGNVPPEIQAWYKKLQEIRQAKTFLTEDFPNQPGGLQHDRTRSLRARFATEELRRLEAAENAIWRKLYEFEPIIAQLQQPQPLPELDELKALLPNSQTALLSFYTTGTATHIFILRQPAQVGEDWVLCHSIPHPNSAEDLQSWLINNWVTPYIAINQGGTKDEDACRDEWHQAMPERLQELSTRLGLDDLIQNHLNGINDLVLIPHLFLHQIPFDLLPTAKGQLLGDCFRIYYAPSTNILKICQQRESTHPEILGIVENATNDLPFASLECEKVAQMWGVNTEKWIKGSTATPERYQNLLKQVQALLSSHHATSRADDPLSSHLSLANEQKVTLRDLLSPLWRFPQLLDVFLSCCETGLSFAQFRDQEGNIRRELLDEPLSLGTGFLIAGARSVISTHWVVDDWATGLFSREYHRARQAGQGRLTALHQARQVLRSKTQQDWLQDLEPDYIQAYQNTWQLHWAKDPNTSAADARYEAICKINEWLKNNFQSEDIPLQDYRYWGAFYCLGLP